MSRSHCWLLTRKEFRTHVCVVANLLSNTLKVVHLVLVVIYTVYVVEKNRLEEFRQLSFKIILKHYYARNYQNSFEVVNIVLGFIEKVLESLKYDYDLLEVFR
jgi:hypothetical protein